jgi:hypothetical protein
MSESIISQVNALRRMTVGELRQKYREVYGEETRSGNKDWLWKRIAWRIQELKYGGLSERAKRRAAELANESDIRVRVPKSAFDGVQGAVRKSDVGKSSGASARNRRALLPGTTLTREYKGVVHTVKVLDLGFEYDGRRYKSLSAIAREITGSHWNGNLFFNISNGGRKRT